MTRNLKVLGLALVAILAMSAMAASAAGASTFTATKGATITATDVSGIKFTVTGQEVFCEETTYTGIAPAASFESITISVAYSGCKLPLANATITGFGAGGCDYVFYANGTVDLVCPKEQDVTVDSATCVVHIPAQKGLGTLTYTNNEASGGISIHINITKITNTHTDGFLCLFGGSGHNAEGIFETPAAEPPMATASVGTLTWDA